MRYIGVLIGFLLFFTPAYASDQIPPQPVPVFVDTQNSCLEPTFPKPIPKAPDTLDIYLDKLAICESGNNPTAVNPMDLDGTPSLGRYQFKPSTFNFFSNLYGIATTSIWNGVEQRTIVRLMAQRLTKKEWVHQFPDCTLRHIGYPPGMGS